MRETYTQREWDRTVGWGEVPKEYKTPELDTEKAPPSDINKNNTPEKGVFRSS